MLKRNKILSIVATFFISMSAHSLECSTFNTRYTYKQEKVLKKEMVCVNKELTKASSQNCLVVKNKKCPFKTITKKDKSQTFVSEIGSPAFNLCHNLEGSPQIYEIEIKGTWKTFERCFAKNSQEFADAGELYGLYLAL